MPVTKRRNGNGTAQSQRQAASQVRVPFTSASREHTESAFDTTVTPGANAQQLGPFDIPAYGYYRHFLLLVETTSEGELEAEGEASADFPWNIFSNVQVSDVNGANIFGPLSGYSTMWSSVLGGYAGRPDPRIQPFFSEEATSPKFLMRVPQEISHFNGFGSLANQTSAANYKVFLTVPPASDLGDFATAPTLRIRGIAETWSLPDAMDNLGRAQDDQPPMLDTSQFYSRFLKDVQSGQNTILMTRVGSLIRNLIFVARDSEGNRSDGAFPDPVSLEWDAQRMRTDPQDVITEHMVASVPELNQRDTGVFAYLFDRSHKNTVGDDKPTFWYPTVQSTRLEISGSTEEGGTLEIITNDVAPVAVTPEERYSEGGTGFDPAGVANVGSR